MEHNSSCNSDIKTEKGKHAHGGHELHTAHSFCTSWSRQKEVMLNSPSRSSCSRQSPSKSMLERDASSAAMVLMLCADKSPLFC